MPVKIGAKVNSKSAQGLIESIKWAVSPEFAGKALGLDRIKLKLLRYLTEIFPKAKPADRRPDRKYRPHLVTGFRSYDVPGLKSKQGFVIKHRAVSEPFTRKLLMSLEKGSKAYIQQLGDRKVFSFHPGDRRGQRHTKFFPPDFAGDQFLRIPARRGGNYMKKVYTEARRLLAEAKPEYLKKVKRAIKQRQRK